MEWNENGAKDESDIWKTKDMDIWEESDYILIMHGMMD